MKLHLHRADVDGCLYDAYTRDKAGKILAKRISVDHDGIELVFKRSDWRYIKSLSLNFGDISESIKKFRSELEKNGVVIARVDLFPHTIFVYNAQFDNYNARIYSIDKDLSRFKARQKDLSLSPLGDYMGYDELEFVDTLEKKFYFEIEEIGINLKRILDDGFFIVKVNDIDELEGRRRFIQRQLRKYLPDKVTHLGIRVENISVGSVEYQRKEDTKILQETSGDSPIKTDKNAINTEASNLRNPTKEKRYISNIIINTGLIASILTILAYFKFDIEWMRLAIAWLWAP